MRFKLIETLLNEDIEAVKKQYPDIDDETFNWILRNDPTYTDGSNSVGKFSKWMLNQFKKGNIWEDDHTGNLFYLEADNDNGEISHLMDEYAKALKDKNVEKDINRFKTPLELRIAISNSQDKELTDRQKARLQKNASSEVKKVYEDKYWTIYVPLSYAGSVYLGKGTNWCTAAQSRDGKLRYAEYTGDTSHLNKFDELGDYEEDDWGSAEQGDLYVLICKSQCGAFSKMQFHFETQSFMDMHDDDIFETQNVISNYFLDGVCDFFIKEGYEDLRIYDLKEINDATLDEINELLPSNHQAEIISSDYSYNEDYFAICNEDGDDIIEFTPFSEQRNDWDYPVIGFTIHPTDIFLQSLGCTEKQTAFLLQNIDLPKSDWHIYYMTIEVRKRTPSDDELKSIFNQLLTMYDTGKVRVRADEI